MVIENILLPWTNWTYNLPILIIWFFLGLWDLIGYIYHSDNCAKQEVNRDEFVRHYLKSSKVGVKGLWVGHLKKLQVHKWLQCVSQLPIALLANYKCSMIIQSISSPHGWWSCMLQLFCNYLGHKNVDQNPSLNLWPILKLS